MKSQDTMKYRYQMERRIDAERRRLNKLLGALEENDAPKPAIKAMRNALNSLNKADAAL